MQDTFEKESILERLVRKVSMAEWEAGAAKAAIVAKARGIPENAVALYLKDLYQLTLPVENKSSAFTDQMTRLVKQVLIIAHPPLFLLRNMCSSRLPSSCLYIGTLAVNVPAILCLWRRCQFATKVHAVSVTASVIRRDYPLVPGFNHTPALIPARACSSSTCPSWSSTSMRRMRPSTFGGRRAATSPTASSSAPISRLS